MYEFTKKFIVALYLHSIKSNSFNFLMDTLFPWTLHFWREEEEKLGMWWRGKKSALIIRLSVYSSCSLWGPTCQQETGVSVICDAGVTRVGVLSRGPLCRKLEWVTPMAHLRVSVVLSLMMNSATGAISVQGTAVTSRNNLNTIFRLHLPGWYRADSSISSP